MLNVVNRFAKSSIGKKVFMAVTGLLLVGFLISHVGGNSLLLASDGGEAYNAYAAKLRGFGPILWVARIGLATLFLVHIYLGLHVSAKNRRARGVRYQVKAIPRNKTLSSSSMLATGLIVLAFLVPHLWHFSFDRRFNEQGAALVKDTLRLKGVVALYAAGILGLWIHLWHALPSALQTLGLSHLKWSATLKLMTRITISLICSLFLIILLATTTGMVD